MSGGVAGRCSWRRLSANAGKRSRDNPGLVLPLRQFWEPRQRRLHGAAHIAERQPLGERVSRLDQRQIGKTLFVDHAIGMHHLQHAVVEFGGAGDVAGFAFGQQFLQIVLRAWK